MGDQTAPAGTSNTVGVLDKVVRLFDALEMGPANLATLVEITGMTRPTVHRIAVALEHARLVGRDAYGHFMIGHRVEELARAMGSERHLRTAATPVLERLHEISGSTVRVWQRQGRFRRCVAVVEASRDDPASVSMGELVPMTAGSAAHVLLAWEEPEHLHAGLIRAVFTASAVSATRRRGWSQSVGERLPTHASVSAPVWTPKLGVMAAVSVSGPVELLSREPGRRHAPAVISAARRLSAMLREGDPFADRASARLEGDPPIDPAASPPTGSMATSA